MNWNIDFVTSDKKSNLPWWVGYQINVNSYVMQAELIIRVYIGRDIVHHIPGKKKGIYFSTIPGYVVILQKEKPRRYLTDMHVEVCSLKWNSPLFKLEIFSNTQRRNFPLFFNMYRPNTTFPVAKLLDHVWFYN